MKRKKKKVKRDLEYGGVEEDLSIRAMLAFAFICLMMICGMLFLF